MNLVELVALFKSGKSYEEFCDDYRLDADSEVIEIYMTKPMSIEESLAFYPIEVTEGKVQFIYNSVEYYNLFDFYYFIDAIEEVKGTNYTDREVAGKLLNYAMLDA